MERYLSSELPKFNREQLWEIGLLSTRIKIGAERTLGKRLSDMDYETIEATTLQCFVEGERDGFVIYWRCLLELSEFADVWDDIRRFLANRIH
jgi:hypothetical protein